jgi:hypothetical protein
MGGRGGNKRFMFRYVGKVREEIEEQYQAADASLQVDINAVDTTVDTILSGSTESLDAFVEVVQVFQAADSENSGSITALAVAAQQDRAAIRTEFAAADTSLQADITTEAASRASALATALSDRAAIRTEFTAADTSLQADITTEATSRASALATALSDRAAIRTEFATADTTLQANITAEATSRAAADATLQASIDAIEINSGAVAGMNMILAGPNGKKYHFSIDNNGTPSVEEITNVAEVPDTSVILATPNGDRYRFAIDATGTPYVEIVV